MLWGGRNHNPVSRFLAEVPAELVEEHGRRRRVSGFERRRARASGSSWSAPLPPKTVTAEERTPVGEATDVAPGERVVVSAQFLVDSESSLRAASRRMRKPENGDMDHGEMDHSQMDHEGKSHD
jgi:hypothetical protein